MSHLDIWKHIREKDGKQKLEEKTMAFEKVGYA